jgi:hypothetical protein
VLLVLEKWKAWVSSTARRRSSRRGRAYEIRFIDDGSRDGSIPV